MKKIDYIIYGVTSLAAMIFTGCYEVEDFSSVPENVEAPEIVSIGSNSVKFKESDVNGNVRYRLSTRPDFPESETKEDRDPYFNNLISNKRYYYQAVVYNDYYGIDEEHALYGEVKTFVTAQGFGNMNIYNDAKKTKIEDRFATPEKAVPLRFSYDIGGNEIPVTEAGFCFDYKNNLTKDNCAIVIKGEINEENHEVSIKNLYDSKLKHGEYIYVRPYISTDEGIYYGERNHVYIFSGFVGDNPYIDLGLPSGTKWFVWDFGINEFGGNNNSSKYCYSFSSDIPASEIPVGCSVPTCENAKELADNCTSTKWDWSKGEGLKVTGPNGNVIYFSFRGYYIDYWDGPCWLWSDEEMGYILLDGSYEKGGETYQRIYVFSYESGLTNYMFAENPIKLGRDFCKYNVRFVKD